MPVDLLPPAVDLLVQQATACGLQEVFHVSPRDRSHVVDLLPVLAVDLLVQQATACGLPEVFHVSPRSRSIAHVLDLRRWRDHASDRSEVFRLQANDVTWPGVACVHVCMSMKLGMHSV